MYRRFRYRLKRCYGLKFLVFVTCWSFIFIQYISTKLFYWEEIPSPILSRLYPNLPLTFNLQSYSICHPDKFYIENLLIDYHQYVKEETCFLIEHLDGGPWWSYVTQEFAEILTYLKKLGIQSNITYRSFSSQLNFNLTTNLTQYFLNSCQFNEKFYLQNKNPIIILLWDINRLLWHKMSDQWNSLLKILSIRIMVFIDDLHYTKKEIFQSHQYLFESIASEIFSTYAYLFHNYYSNISSFKITWLPHAASSLSSYTINYSAKKRLFISGANIFEWYPCRSRAFLVCKLRDDLTACLKHPGYGETMKNDSSFFYGGKRYFSYMNQYVFGLGTCQSVHYAVAKIFELPANGLVLITTKDLIPILEKLHLYYDKHFLTIECSSVNEIIKEIISLQNISNEKITQIRIKSQEIIHQYHMTQHRAQLLHVRLLAQALITISPSHKKRILWERWGRNCH